MLSKECFKCHKVKPLSEFYRHSEMSDGHLGKCKECTKLDNRANRESKREQYSVYEFVRNQTPDRKFCAARHRDKMRKAHPDKYIARSAVSNALRSGRLTRQPCEVCGNPKSEAHHHDYSKPLDVRWLCFKHHRELGHFQVVVIS